MSDACYILLSGEAAVYVGHDKIATVEPGEVIGESALKRGKLRGATVTTTGRAEVLHIDRDDLDRLLEGGARDAPTHRRDGGAAHARFERRLIYLKRGRHGSARVPGRRT